MSTYPPRQGGDPGSSSRKRGRCSRALGRRAGTLRLFIYAMYIILQDLISDKQNLAQIEHNLKSVKTIGDTSWLQTCKSQAALKPHQAHSKADARLWRGLVEVVIVSSWPGPRTAYVYGQLSKARHF